MKKKLKSKWLSFKKNIDWPTTIGLYGFACYPGYGLLCYLTDSTALFDPLLFIVGGIPVVVALAIAFGLFFLFVMAIAVAIFGPIYLVWHLLDKYVFHVTKEIDDYFAKLENDYKTGKISEQAYYEELMSYNYNPYLLTF